MLFNTLVLATLASAVATANTADSCAAGSILGIYAMCGTFPVDCGKGLCCLQGQKCVSGGCTDPKLTDDGGKVLTVKAACYGSFDHMTPPSSKVTSAPAVYVTNPSTIATPSSAVNIGQLGAGDSSGPKATFGAAPYTNGTGSAAGKDGIAASTGTSSGTSPSTSVVLSNSAVYTSPQAAGALLLSGAALVVFWL
ncbi:hypothetical protein EJ08DRAFT_696909 [Tothia fuscella]|uniref:Uncharacterized protein n=1 Tax=Tothia fuscella TaxID=1048955 RepID=A0A9P4NSR8_9PEZI|nr:hypothetical protein EJ08DRAFT_696909 [Tothia fuscella]